MILEVIARSIRNIIAILLRSGNFETLEKEGKPAVSYDISLIKDNLRDT